MFKNIFLQKKALPIPEGLLFNYSKFTIGFIQAYLLYFLARFTVPALLTTPVPTLTVKVVSL